MAPPVSEAIAVNPVAMIRKRAFAPLCRIIVCMSFLYKMRSDTEWPIALTDVSVDRSTRMLLLVLAGRDPPAQRHPEVLKTSATMDCREVCTPDPTTAPPAIQNPIRPRAPPAITFAFSRLDDKRHSI